MHRRLLQFHGQTSCVFWGDCGAVGDVPHAASVPSRETARTNRTTSCRDMPALLERGERDAWHFRRWDPVTRGYKPSREVT